MFYVSSKNTVTLYNFLSLYFSNLKSCCRATWGWHKWHRNMLEHTPSEAAVMMRWLLSLSVLQQWKGNLEEHYNLNLWQPRKTGKRAHRGNNPIRAIHKTIFTVYIVEFMKFGTFNLTSNWKHKYSSTGHYLYTNQSSRFNYDSIYHRISVVNSISAINTRNRFPHVASMDMDVITWQQAMVMNMDPKLMVCPHVIRDPVLMW